MQVNKINSHQREYIKSYGMVQFNEHYKHVQSHNSLSELKEVNRDNGRHYFDKDTIASWGSHIFSFKKTCFIDRVYGPSFFFRRVGPKYKYKVMIICKKGSVITWSISDNMKEAKKEQKELLSMSMVDIEKILNEIR
jgi:hypothetical protein